ncbi:hypothetical protein [Burkholderia vietnamiensis]|uniref:hypothetical protein n=1 Tax=Burkholderia vietnamiensis TaxID=60552 RepID=UPI000759DA9B|nr:hypothetical protein [Burkholderia vietnamiensis]KVR92133.1 hypothetical protein WK27_05815 [Burkholderia vietnamiensis]MCA8068536.1 hypothetical protein [Burkholderia vietnamiensis]
MFQEFPIWVTGPKGESRIVETQEAFEALGAGWTKPDRSEAVPREKQPDFVEYPKWVGDVIVQNAEEEAALLGSDNSDERAALIQIAAEKGVKIDKRWSDDKIRAALEAA